MALQARIRELGVRHQTLDRAIDEELSRPAADETRVKTLKRAKLKLKEEIQSLEAKLH